MTVPELDALRVAIDEVDRKILALIAERVKLVLKVGEVKRIHRMAVYDPSREARVLDQLASIAPEPLDADTVRRLFECLIGESRRIEQRHVGDPEAASDSNRKG